MAFLTGGLLDFLSKLMEKSEGGSYNRATDSNEAISEAIAGIGGYPGYVVGATIVEDSAMETGAPNTVMPVSGIANTFGNWVEVDAAVSADSYINSILVTCKELLTNNTDTDFVVEIGTGAGGSEVSKIRFSGYYEAGSAVGGLQPFIFTLSNPIKVASGTRIAVQVSDNVASEQDYKVSIQYYQGL